MSKDWLIFELATIPGLCRILISQISGEMMGIDIQQLKKGLLNLFLKSNCPLCDRPTPVEFCEYCQKQLQRCQLKNPSQLWQGELPLFIWGNYGGTLKQAIAVLKYENKLEIARPLGHWLGKSWLKSPSICQKKLTVVPIPLHSAKLQQRGFNQAELIAKSFCEYTGYKQQPLGLERIRETEAQFKLTPQQREENLADAFIVGKSLVQKSTSPVLLVDDIYTTGATVRAAAAALRRQGIEVYGLVAIASSHKMTEK